MGTYSKVVYAGAESTCVQAWLLADGTHAIIAILADNGSLDEGAEKRG